MNELIPNIGSNYKDLLSYQKCDVIYQITYYFCEQFLRNGDRTIDQMIQAARSGKQNIIEGCAASSTSAKTEIKLINVAKASLQELLEDYEDYLKTRGHRRWEKGSVEFETMRKLGREHNDAQYFMNIICSRPPETIANMIIILIKQADYLLYRQLQRLSSDFLKHGGFSERMTYLRRKNRDKTK
ncbi:MAG: four helix bundle suffix domain-containing protein [Muribaculaceae bacterium]|nr:four helix bundle suffix domain-containing protein [Muribaculaceae bacterium]